MTIPHRRKTDSERNGSPAPLRALVVDDDENYRTFIRVLLKRLGFHVTEAADGLDAERAVISHVFDLLIIDCEMPRIDGLALIEEVRDRGLCTDAYAMMLTGRQDLDTKINALRLGFDDFIVKTTPEVEIVAKFGAARRLITRQRRLDAAVRELYGLATRDELTGLYNRRYFFQEAERMIGEQIPITLVLIDLDGFKRVNDTFGHLAGDRILRDVGSLFLRGTRHEDLIARYGGDEFVLLVRNGKLQEVEALAARLAGEIAQMQWTLGSQTISIGATTGIASSLYLDAPTLSQILNAGDRDLYKNKWVRTHPDVDPSLYEYPEARAARAEELSDLIQFRPQAQRNTGS